jgi:hypothetical protein
MENGRWKLETGYMCLLERRYRFGKVIAKRQGQPLIEEFLSDSGLRRDFSPVGTDIIDKRRVLPSWNRQAALSHRIGLL